MLRLAATLLAPLALLLTCAPSRPLHGTDAATIVRQGNGRGAPPCMACHGIDGGGQRASGNPRLAALNATYLAKQLDDFASGARSSALMTVTAKALSEPERQGLARYYSALPLPPALARPPTALPPPDSDGAVLAMRGRWSRQVPACVQCHGPHGVGVGANFPPLAGQPAVYIAAQLKAWQNGSRHNDPLQLMQHVADALSAQDIQAVAHWFAAQPLPAPKGQP